MSKQQLFIQLLEQLSDAKLFYGHAVVDAEDEAMMVMMSVFEQNVQEILTSGDEIVSKDKYNKALDYVAQRLTSLQPMAYILGVVNFAGLEFNIDARALVPRSPIAELIINKFNSCLDISKINSVLDLCTGSGCIGISVAKYCQQIQCDIADISSEALSLAQENIKFHEVKVGIIKSDLFQAIDKQYDLILSNPPYVSNSEYKGLPKEYKYEPKLGLVSKQMGLQIPVQIMLQGVNYLHDNGYLILEVGHSDKLLAKTFPKINFNWIKFSNGGQGVCVFTKKMLLKYQTYFKDFLETS